MEIIIQVIAFHIYFQQNETNVRLHNQNSVISLIITTFALSEPPLNSTKEKHGKRIYTQRLSIKELNIPGSHKMPDTAKANMKLAQQNVAKLSGLLHQKEHGKILIDKIGLFFFI